MVSFLGNADVFFLDAVLKVAHGSQNHEFAIAPESIEVAQVMPSWGKKRYSSKIKALLKFNYLIKGLYQITHKRCYHGYYEKEPFKQA